MWKIWKSAKIEAILLLFWMVAQGSADTLPSTTATLSKGNVNNSTQFPLFTIWELFLNYDIRHGINETWLEDLRHQKQNAAMVLKDLFIHIMRFEPLFVALKCSRFLSLITHKEIYKKQDIIDGLKEMIKSSDSMISKFPNYWVIIRKTVDYLNSSGLLASSDVENLNIPKVDPSPSNG